MLYLSKVGDIMDNNISYKCPRCDAVLKFNNEKNKFQCEYCRSEFDLNKLNSKEKNKSLNIYTCNNCGSNIISDNSINITSCIYCKDKNLQHTTIAKFSADYIIPFKVTKKDAINKLKKLYKGKWLKPREFKNKTINDIKGIYVPISLFSYDAIGVVEIEGDIANNWISDGYRYIKTDKYKLLRGGKMSFENIPVECSKSFDNSIFRLIEPYNYKELKQFNHSYLSGYLSGNYDLTKEELINKASDSAKEYFGEEIKKDIKGYNNLVITNNTTNLNNLRYIYVLIPIWLLNIKYKNKLYTFAINGQTGKVTGYIPKSKNKIILLWIVTFIIVFILTLLLEYFRVTL